MTVSPETKAVLLLTARFPKSGSDSIQPLSSKEWYGFAAWLRDHELTPEHLFENNLRELLKEWSDRKITLDRLQALLERGPALALALEKWLRAGLWVMTRSDTDYPSRLKKQLGAISPAVLYGCGNRSLLDRGALAVVGSRKVMDDDLDYARQFGSAAAKQGCSIVSGGARGVDEAVMLGALENKGTVIGVLAHSLLRACSGAKFRQHLMANNLALVSAVHPEAGFNAGNAMQRNKYVYCLSDAAIVVHAGRRGGTWSGAMENLKERWVPLWIKPTSDAAAGNQLLVRQGGHWISEDVSEVRFKDLLHSREAPMFNNKASLISEDPDFPNPASSTDKRPEEVDIKPSSSPELAAEPAERSVSMPSSAGAPSTAIPALPPPENADSVKPYLASTPDENDPFYDLFLQKLLETCAQTPQTPEELAKRLNLGKSQVNAWLKRALDGKKVRKLQKPVRYICERTAPLFEGRLDSAFRLERITATITSA